MFRDRTVDGTAISFRFSCDDCNTFPVGFAGTTEKGHMILYFACRVDT